jgi:hypothetical protein
MLSFFPIIAVLAAWSCLFLAIVDAGAIASWTTGQGAPQIIFQDDDTGKILYSLCNSNETTVFPANESASLTFDKGFEPKKGTSLAGVGYIDGYGVTTVSSF